MMKVSDVTLMRYGTTRLYWAEMSIPPFQMLSPDVDSSKFLISDINTGALGSVVLPPSLVFGMLMLTLTVFDDMSSNTQIWPTPTVVYEICYGSSLLR